MDERTATLTLTEKLHQLGYVNHVIDAAMKSHILENAKSSVLGLGCSNPEVIDFNEIDLSKDTKSEEFSKLKEKFPQANYLFAEVNKTGLEAELGKTLITPAAIIGKEEERILKNKYYKDVSYQVRWALDILEIPNFIEAYKIYSSLDPQDFDLKKIECENAFKEKDPSKFYVPFKKEDSVEIGDVVKGTITHKYYLVDKIEEEKVWGSRFNDSELKSPCHDKIHGACVYENMIKIYKYHSEISEDFQKFVFSLPPEDQDIEINKIILRAINNHDARAQILYAAYCEEKHFPQYFGIADMFAQKQAVNALRSIKIRNPDYDHFLWDNGFKDVNLNHMQLYKNDTGVFIDYFSSRTEPEKKTILNEIMTCDFSNKQADSWLHENELELIRTVSMDG